MSALLVLVLLASSPDAPMPLPPASSELELVIPERMIEALLVAAAPFDKVVHQDVSVLGMTQRVRLDLRLMRPRVKVARDGVRVTFDYDLRGPGGISARGQVTPTLQLRAMPGKGMLEGRLTGARLSASAVEIPVDDLLDPVLIPALAEGPLEVGWARVEAQVSAREVVLEEGRVRVIGAYAFRKALPQAVSVDVP